MCYCGCVVGRSEPCANCQLRSAKKTLSVVLLRGRSSVRPLFFSTTSVTLDPHFKNQEVRSQNPVFFLRPHCRWRRLIFKCLTAPFVPFVCFCRFSDPCLIRVPSVAKDCGVRNLITHPVRHTVMASPARTIGKAGMRWLPLTVNEARTLTGCVPLKSRFMER